MSDEMTETTGAGEDFTFDVPSDVGDAPEVLDAGRYGESGEASIVKFQLEPTPGNDPPINPNTGEPYNYLSIVVAVDHPEKGRLLVGSTPFRGRPGCTSMQPKSGSKAHAWGSALGVLGESMATAQATAIGKQVVATVSKRGYKDKASGEQRWTNDLVDLVPYGS